MTRFKIVIVSLVAALLAACTVTPDGTTPEDLVNYEAAVASVGCELSGESDYLPVELQAGLTRQQVLDISAHMLATGKAERLENGGVKLTTGACA